ncbi:MAG: UvrD-helicase domain-containing protein [Promethearchaeota archaeon]
MTNLRDSFPDNFIGRFFSAEKQKNYFNFKKKGISTSSLYTQERIWNGILIDDIKEICKKILINLNEINLDNESFNNKKIISLDICATTWEPKAKEGFVSVIGISILDLKNKQGEKIELEIKQYFNMNRRKEDAPKLLNLIQPYMIDADILVVFNKQYTIGILNNIIRNNNLKFDFPEEIINLKTYFNDIENLEKFLLQKTEFSRKYSFNRDYNEYYKLFKKRNKPIDPLGILNITNTLEFLYIFLLMAEEGKIKMSTRNEIKKFVTEEDQQIFKEISRFYLPETQPLPFLLEEDEFMGYIEEINKNPFNEEQKSAIKAPYDKPCYIVAGPGSGKTTVLVFRILKLLFVDGLLPENILATTFTKKAARELKGRIIDKGYKLIELIKSSKDDKKFSKVLKKFDLNRIIVGTLDSICENLLVQDYRPTIIQLKIIDDVVAKGIFRRKGLEDTLRNECFDRNEMINKLKNFARDIENLTQISYRSLINFLININERLIQEQISLDVFQEHLENLGYDKEVVNIIIKIYKNNREYLKNNGLLDYGMLEEQFLKSLNSSDYDLFTNQLKAILIDEYQDTNYLQERIYFELAKKTNGAITIVGDDDQSLYRFRGAIVNLFKFFPERIKNELGLTSEPDPIYLNTNYRSTKTIINFYNEFLKLDQSYFNASEENSARIEGKPLVKFPDENDNSEDFPVILLLRDNIVDLAKEIAKIINDIFNKNGANIEVRSKEMLKNILIQRNRDEKGIYIDSVLLASSPREVNTSGNPTLMGILREELKKYDIKVFNPRGFELNNIQEVKILLGLLLLCLDPKENFQNNLRMSEDIKDKILLWRSKANKFIIAKDNEELKKFIKQWQERKPTKKRKNWPQSVPILELIYKLSKFIPKFHNDPEFILYFESLVSLINKIAEFSPWRAEFIRFIIKDGNKIDVEKNCVEDFYYNFFIPIAYGDLDLNEDLIENFPEDRFNIMSIHQSKGLEFPLVFIDVCSEFKTDHRSQRFKRFPDRVFGSYGYEKLLRDIKNSPDDNRGFIDHAFDDLIRKFFVAYSRAQSLLILVGINPKTKRFRDNGQFIPNVALGFDRTGFHKWNRKDCNYLWYENNNLN